MHKPKPYTCPVCGAEVPDLPMPVLKHQMSHVSRRPFAGVREKPLGPERPRTDREGREEEPGGKGVVTRRDR